MSTQGTRGGRNPIGRIGARGNDNTHGRHTIGRIGARGNANSELDRYLAVTSADIQRVARRYLAPQRRVVLDVRPAP